MDAYSAAELICYSTCILSSAVCTLAKFRKNIHIRFLKHEKLCMIIVVASSLFLGLLFQKFWRKKLYYSNTVPCRYKPANKTSCSSLGNQFILNPKNNSTWKKDAYRFFWLLLKGSGELAFSDLKMTGVTTCDDGSATTTWPKVLSVIDIFKPVLKSFWD